MAAHESTTLERELDELLQHERFDPPEEFVSRALDQDESEHERADADYEGWWKEQAKDLHWFQEPTEGLDASDAPFFKWFKDGKLNACYNALDRHVEAGLG